MQIKNMNSIQKVVLILLVIYSEHIAGNRDFGYNSRNRNPFREKRYFRQSITKTKNHPTGAKGGFLSRRYNGLGVEVTTPASPLELDSDKSIKNLNEHKKRLRKLLTPLPRHIAGPRPTIISNTVPDVEADEAVAPETSSEFQCPSDILIISSKKAARGRNWKAFPDPFSCRHYYICLFPESVSEVNDETSAVRHSCEAGRVFNKITETCDISELLDCNYKHKQRNKYRSNTKFNLETKNQSDRWRLNADKKGLFVEFIKFLIKIGMFNKDTVLTLLNNKDFFY